MMEMIEMGLRASRNQAGLSDDEVERIGIGANDGRNYERNLRPAAGLKLCISNKGYFGWVPGASSPGDVSLSSKVLKNHMFFDCILAVISF